MKSVQEYIESGILEMYVLGLTSDQENVDIEKMAAAHPEINDEINAISESLIAYSQNTAPNIDPTLKSLVMGIIDYTERLKNGEVPYKQPVLNENSRVLDFAEWLDREDMVLTEDAEDFVVKLIGHDAQAMTAIVWIKEATPYELHEDVYEKFLVVEGTCDIITDTGTHSLVPGSYYSLPLNLGHVVKVTSAIPCKVILQRVAA